MGRKKQQKYTYSCGPSSEEEEEVVKQTSVIEFVCPMCQKMIEMQNELEIHRKGNCTCSRIPTGFNKSKKDKTMNIDKLTIAM